MEPVSSQHARVAKPDSTMVGWIPEDKNHRETVWGHSVERLNNGNPSFWPLDLNPEQVMQHQSQLLQRNYQPLIHHLYKHGSSRAPVPRQTSTGSDNEFFNRSQ